MIKDIFSNGVKTVQDLVNKKKQEIKEINDLTANGNQLNELMPISLNDTSSYFGRENMIFAAGLSINRTIAKNINQLIPINETVLSVIRANYLKTKKDIYFIATNNKLWLLSNNQTKVYNYSEIFTMKIINSSLLTQGVNFNNMAFNFEGRNNDVFSFIELVTNENKRNEIIGIKTKYLAGITPSVQYLNDNLSGISINDEGICVLHDKCTTNTLVNIKDIEYMQILLDNAVVLTRGKTNMTAQNSSLAPCHKMCIKFVLNDTSYLIDILSENSMSSVYKVEDTAFQTNFKFAISLIDSVNGLSKSI